MIRVTVSRDSGTDTCTGIELEGHAGFGDYGQDVICAAVSALALNMANSVETFTSDRFEGGSEEETGHFWFRFTGQISSESRLLMNSLVLGIRNIQREYGNQYIHIRVKEV